MLGTKQGKEVPSPKKSKSQEIDSLTPATTPAFVKVPGFKENLLTREDLDGPLHLVGHLTINLMMNKIC